MVQVVDAYLAINRYHHGAVHGLTCMEDLHDESIQLIQQQTMLEINVHDSSLLQLCLVRLVRRCAC